MARKLTPKQERFIEEYLVDLNATQAAIRAGYSERSADVTGSKLLGNAKVAAAVAHAQARRGARVGAEADDVLREFARLGLYDPADIASQPMHGPEDIAKLPEHVRRAVIGWGWDKFGNFTLKLANKQAALDSMAKHFGMYIERVEHSGELPVIVVKREG